MTGKIVNFLARIAGGIRNSGLIKPSNPIYRFLRSIGKQLVRIVAKNAWVEVDIGGTGNIRLDHQFAFAGFEKWGRAHNCGFAKCIELCHGKSIFFDIGAHIGLYSLPVSRVLKQGGIIYAFEPAKRNCDVLLKHLEYNDIRNVRLVSSLVGETTEDRASFYEDKNVDGMNSIVLPKNPHLYTKTEKKQISLDDFCRENNVIPEVIKIDVEGAELNVLKGGAHILREFHPQLILSVHPRDLGLLGHSAGELAEYIISTGYGIYDMDGSRISDRLELKEYYLH